MLRYSQEDMAWWWGATGPILALMMEKAGYSVESQAAGLLFYYKWIVPALGPRPTIHGDPVGRRDFMTDDLSPIEMSWSWDDSSIDPNSKPKIRYAIEPIGFESESQNDMSNIHASQKLINNLKSSIPGINWTWLERLQKAFKTEAIESEQGTSPASLRKRSANSFLGFETNEMNVDIKGYLRVPEALSAQNDPLSSIFQAVRSLETNGVTFPALDRLGEFLKSDPVGSSLEVLDVPGLAVDCVDPQIARLKIYVRSKDTRFETVMKVLNLGDQDTQLTPLLLSELFPLWKNVFGCSEDFSTSDRLTELHDECAGVLYNFEFKSGSPSVSPKLYIPVKYYGVSDGCAAYGLTNYLRQRGRSRYTGAYLDLIQSMCYYKSLGSTQGLQTYIQCGFKKGSLSLTSYISPQIYHKDKWHHETIS